MDTWVVSRFWLQIMLLSATFVHTWHCCCSAQANCSPPQLCSSPKALLFFLCCRPRYSTCFSLLWRLSFHPPILELAKELPVLLMLLMTRNTGLFFLVLSVLWHHSKKHRITRRTNMEWYKAYKVFTLRVSNSGFWLHEETVIWNA